MLIKIISGSYGHRPTLPNGKKSPYVIPVTPDDLPIDVDQEEGDGLIAEGIAESAEPKAEKTSEAPKAATPAPKKGRKQKAEEQEAEDVTE